MKNRAGFATWLLVSLYPLSLALFTGAVLVDVVYARLLANPVDLATDGMFRNVSDLLLKVGLLVFLIGCAAIAAAWQAEKARLLFIVSLFVLFTLEFMLPVLFMGIGPFFGAMLRITVNVSAATLAMLGLYQYTVSGHAPV